MKKDDAEELAVTLEEIRAFRKEMLLMHGVLATDMVEAHPIIKEISDLFLSRGLDKVWLDKHLAVFVGTDIAEDKELLISYILDELDSMLHCEVEENREKKAHIFVGATGVGKTTLVGKLGARYAYLLEKKQRVAFCNIDRHKLGATEQLMHYSDAMEIPLLTLETLSDDYEQLFIDTSGVYAQTLQELEELFVRLEECSYSLELSLVLSATAKEVDMVHMMEFFKRFKIESFIFTKLDETDDISDMIRFLMRYDKPIRYLSIGQEIPEDLIVASNEYILKKFMIRRDDNE